MLGNVFIGDSALGKATRASRTPSKPRLLDEKTHVQVVVSYRRLLFEFDMFGPLWLWGRNEQQFRFAVWFRSTQCPSRRWRPGDD